MFCDGIRIRWRSDDAYSCRSVLRSPFLFLRCLCVAGFGIPAPTQDCLQVCETFERTVSRTFRIS